MIAQFTVVVRNVFCRIFAHVDFSSLVLPLSCVLCFALLPITFFCIIVCTRKTRLLDVMYNASDNELLRTKTLVKNAIVQVDAAPFRMWYEAHYGVELGRKKKAKKEEDKVG